MTTKTKTTWRTVRLGDVTSKITKGTTPTTLGRSFTTMGVNFIKAESITDDGRFIPAKFQHIDEETNSMLKRSVVQENDLLYSIAGVIGRPALVTKDVLPANTNQALAIIRPNRDAIDAKFLYYFLTSKSQKQYANNLVAQSAQPNINLEQVSNLEFEAPGLETQKRISGILSAFDEKIENNNRIIKTLEEMAQAIFKEWFVNFRFPGSPYAKATKDKHKKTEFINSSLGRIPKGWEVGMLGDVTDVTIGRTPPREQSHWFCKNGGVKWLSIKDMGDGSVYIFNTVEQLTTKAIAKFNIQTIPANTVVLSFKLTLGRVAITTEEMVSNEAIAHLRLSKGADLFPEYLYLFMRTINLADFGSTSSIGTAVNSKTVRHVPILVPDKHILVQAKEILEPIFMEIKSKLLENQKLATTRDLLLPRLMNGEMQV